LKVDGAFSTPNFMLLEGSSSAVTGNVCPVSQSAMSRRVMINPVASEDF
jgi:hypothetical protein